MFSHFFQIFLVRNVASAGWVYILPGPTNVLCVYNWIVFTQRFDATLNFNRGWIDYRQGFGNFSVRGNFWLGLETMYQLTNSSAYRLRFLLQAYTSGQWYYADYDQITIASEANKYRWHFGTYTGDAGDALRYSTNWNLQDMLFSTSDSSNGYCTTYHFGWWYNNCFYASVTGDYTSHNYCWYSSSQPAGFGDYGKMTASLMMIRRV